MDAVEGDAELVRLAFAVLYRRVGLLEQLEGVTRCLLLGALLAGASTAPYGLAIDPDAVDEVIVWRHIVLLETKFVREVMLLHPLDELALIVLDTRHRVRLHIAIGGEDKVANEVLRTGIALIEVDGSDECLHSVAVDVYRVV